jgi:hypothetical protein
MIWCYLVEHFHSIALGGVEGFDHQQASQQLWAGAPQYPY